MGASGGGDRDVTFRFLADVGDAVEGVKSVGTEVKTLGTEIKETAKAPDELAMAMERAEKAVAKLSDPKLSPIALQRAVLQADIATEGLAEAMKKAAATGGPTPPEMTAKVKAFETAVTSANARAGILRDRLADLRVKGDQAGQGLEKMAQYGGSATSMMQGLADSSTGLVGGFGKAALAVFGFVEALKLGYESGNKVREFWKEMFGTDMPNLTNWFVKLGTGVDNATGAFDRHGIAARSVIGIHNAHAQSIAALAAKIVTLVPEWNKEAEALGKSNEFAKTLSAILKELAADHQDVAKFGKAHADSIITALAPALKAGTISVASMTVEMRLAVRAALDASTAHQEEARSIAAATAKINERFAAEEKATAAKLQSAEKDVEAAQTSISAIYKHRDELIKALKAEEISTEEFNKRKKEITDKASDDVEAATEKETVALGKIEEAHDDYRLSQEKAAKALADATVAAEDQAKAYDLVRDAMVKVDEAFDNVTTGSSSTATELGKAGEAIRSLGPISDLAKGRLAALRSELDELAKAAKRTQDAFAGSKT